MIWLLYWAKADVSYYIIDLWALQYWTALTSKNYQLEFIGWFEKFFGYRKGKQERKNKKNKKIGASEYGETANTLCSE